MRKLVAVVAVSASLLVAGAGVAAATNSSNQASGGPYVAATKVTGRDITLTFVNPNNYYACFEYRTDGNTSQQIGATNFNPAYPGLYPYVCLATAGSQTLKLRVNSYLEVRSVFGAERDWDFDWTRFDGKHA